MWCAHALVVLLVQGAIVARLETTNNICAFPYCECVPSPHPSWTTVNCSLPSGETLNILEGTLPDTTTELIINGGEAVLFGTHSLSRLRDARYIHVFGAKKILMRKHAAYALNIVSIYFEIANSDFLRIESRAFVNIKGPVSTNISNCEFVSIDGEAFSWLLHLSISDVQKLQLGSGAFTLDSTAANVGDHGPGMKIELRNLLTQEFPRQTFGSSAALILLDNVEIIAIRKEAFSANTVNELLTVNSTVHLLEGEAIAQKTLINHLEFQESKIYKIESKALQSAMQNLTISHCRIDQVDEGAINVTVATVTITYSNFSQISEKGLELSSWNKLKMANNSFKKLDANAIVATTGTLHEVIFIENAIHEAHKASLGFIGQAYAKSSHKVIYHDNYYAEACHCNTIGWLGHILDIDSAESFMNQSFCTVDEVLARCFNEPDQNILAQKFIDKVCTIESKIQCEPFKTKTDGATTEIKNPIFPDKSSEEQGGLTARNAKVIAIIIITVFGLILIAIIITIIKWMKRRGYCLKIKNFMISSNIVCCEKLCGFSGGLDNARSISQLSVNEYSERHRLNEPRVQEMVEDTATADNYPDVNVNMDDKTTQTLPEELTKELLESLREKLDDPENYVEAREMIEHLYELIKVEESCNNTPTPNLHNIEENIYELPFQNTTPRVGKNKKQMTSIGTRVPSLDKLTPLSPYNRKTALSHEYFEPKDFAVHLYAEIANSDKDRKMLMNAMPDVVSDQAVPRGPYLRAVRDKLNETNPSPILLKKSISKPQNPQNTSTIKSNKSNTSNSSAKMLNRPLPEKPTTFDPGEGTSYKHG